MSDKKHLLNESTVRRFMKLALIDRLSDQFVTDKDLHEMGPAYARDEEEPFPGDELEGEELPPAPEEELPAEDGTLGEPELAPEEPATEATVSELVDAIAIAITDATGIEVSTEETAEDLEPMEDLPEPEEESAPEEEFPPTEEEPGAEMGEEELMEKMISRVAQRVASRLLKEQK